MESVYLLKKNTNNKALLKFCIWLWFGDGWWSKKKKSKEHNIFLSGIFLNKTQSNNILLTSLKNFCKTEKQSR